MKSTGCLLIHGFGGNVTELDPLKRHLEHQGIKTICPELKGHTGIRGDLGKYNYWHWIESAEEALMELQSQCSKIVLIGFSMGGLIAVNLSRKYSINALVLLNTPIYHWDFKRIAINIVSDFKSKEFTYLRKYTKESANKPISSLINFKLLLKKTKPLLKEIHSPIFIAQALEDATVQHRSAKYIYDNVSSRHKEIKYYEDADHLICCSNASKELFLDINKFINSN